jgi:hypothetical protein
MQSALRKAGTTAVVHIQVSASMIRLDFAKTAAASAQ